MEKDTKIIIGLVTSFVIAIFLVCVAFELIVGPILVESEMVLTFVRSYKFPILLFVALFSVVDAYLLWFFWSSLKEDNQTENYQTQHFRIPPYESYDN